MLTSFNHAPRSTSARSIVQCMSVAALVALAALMVTPIARLAAAQSAAPRTATSSDSAAVMAVVRQLFDGMAERDTVALRSALLPGARFVATLTENPNTAPRISSDADFIASLGKGTDRLLERPWSPVVMVNGRIATAWMPYDFHVNGVQTHCGVDAFTLAKVVDRWMIAMVAYSVDRVSCAPSPLGPPK